MTCVFLACEVFKDELQAMALPGSRISWFPMGLHDQPENLRSLLQESIHRWEEYPEVSDIALLMGFCGGGVRGLSANSATLHIPQAHDCIAVMMGGSGKHEAYLREFPQSYFFSPGWMREGRVPGAERDEILRREWEWRYPDDPEMVEDLLEADRDSYAHHSRAAYVDILGKSEARERCFACSKKLGWDFHAVPVDGSILYAMTHMKWDHPGVVSVPPGACIGFNANARIYSQTVEKRECP